MRLPPQIEDKKRRKAAEKAAELAEEARDDARLVRDVQELAGLSGGPPPEGQVRQIGLGRTL